MCKFANNTKHSRIDHCMRTFVILLSHYLEKHDVKVIACCCGHGVYPMTILIKGKPYEPIGIKNPFKKVEKEIIQDLFSGKIIPRKRNFYKRDKKGIYYIPEVVGGKNGI